MRVLVIGEGDVCRGPVAARLLARHTGLLVTSAGVKPARVGVHKHTVAAAAQAGIDDLASHSPRALDVDLLLGEGQELVVTMTREQVFTVAAYDASYFRTTFTLPELARRCVELGPVDSYASWIAAVGEGRTASDLSPGSVADDIADPYGLAKRAHVAMVEAVDAMALVVGSSMRGFGVG